MDDDFYFDSNSGREPYDSKNFMNNSSSQEKCNLAENEEEEKCQMLDMVNILGELPQEMDSDGFVEYKWRLSPNYERFEHLLTQMQWRLHEGRGRAVYELGVKDNGDLSGMSEEDVVTGMVYLVQIAAVLGATAKVMRKFTKKKDEGGHVYAIEDPINVRCLEVRVAMLGDTGAGKTSLLGVLTKGNLDNGLGSARLKILRHLHEIRTGLTSSVTHEVIGFNCQGEVLNYKQGMSSRKMRDQAVRLVVFTDLAGHKKYLRTTLSGLNSYYPHHCMLVISAEDGIRDMTRVHLDYAVAIKVPIFVVITKSDISNSATLEHGFEISSLENLLKNYASNMSCYTIERESDVIDASCNFEEGKIPVFYVSSVSGHGLKWLTQYLYLISPELWQECKMEEEIFQFHIDSAIDVIKVGMVLSGVTTKGIAYEGQKLLLGPWDEGRFEQVVVTSLHTNNVPCRMVKQSQFVSFTVSPSLDGVRKGMVLLGTGNINIATSANVFQAEIFTILNEIAIRPGCDMVVYVGSATQTVRVLSVKEADDGSEKTASVVLKFQKYPEYLVPGMKMIFRSAGTRGCGRITQLFTGTGSKHTFQKKKKINEKQTVMVSTK